MPNHDLQSTPLVFRPARAFLEPTLTRDGTLDGAWWPRSTNLHRELPALVGAVQARLGPILRVRVELTAWDGVPAHLMIDGRFLRVSGFSGTAGTVRLIRGNQDGFLLMVIPPGTPMPAATAAMRTAARTGNALSAAEILAGCRAPTPGRAVPDIPGAPGTAGASPAVEMVEVVEGAERSAPPGWWLEARENSLYGRRPCTPVAIRPSCNRPAHRSPDPDA